MVPPVVASLPRTPRREREGPSSERMEIESESEIVERRERTAAKRVRPGRVRRSAERRPAGVWITESPHESTRNGGR